MDDHPRTRSLARCVVVGRRHPRPRTRRPYGPRPDHARRRVTGARIRRHRHRRLGRCRRRRRSTRCPALVVLVGHSGGGNVAYGAADARPDRVARVVFVDTFPPADGGSIWEFPIVDGVIPFPGWDFFDEQEVADLDESTRAAAGPRARSPCPRRCPTDAHRLRDERRRRVPVTMLTGARPGGRDPRHHRRPRPRGRRSSSPLEDLEIVELRLGPLAAVLAAGRPRGEASWPRSRSAEARVSGPSPGRRRRG